MLCLGEPLQLSEPLHLGVALLHLGVPASPIFVAPLSLSDPIGGFELVLGCSFNSFCLIFNLFVCFFFFCKSVATRIPGPIRRAGPNRSPVYSDRFHLSSQNILFMSFRFRVFNYAEAFSNGRPINIYSYTIHLQNDVSCLYKMIYKTIV